MREELRIGIPFLEPVWPYVDPATDYTPVSMNVVYNVYERLVDVRDAPGGGIRVQPGLASEWSVADDGRTYRFELREHARFAGGGRLSADDVVFSLLRLLEMSEPPSHLLPIEGVRAIGATTVEIVFERPTSAALIALSSPAASIVDRMTLESHDGLGREWLTSHSAGSGPFVLGSRDRR
jgi:peptide/nickel transport system substrate-binding protein